MCLQNQTFLIFNLKFFLLKLTDLQPNLQLSRQRFEIIIKKKLPTTNKMKFFNIALLAASAFALK